MNSIILAILAFSGYLLAYRFYGRYLSKNIFCIDDCVETPAVCMRDEMDYMPAKKQILFGHHYTSIAGTGPIVGPAIGIIWGWLPAFLWVFFGAIFMGAVHDFGAIIISARNRGVSIGDCAGEVMNPRVRAMFLSIIFLLLLIVIAIFAMIIALLFEMYPQSVLPIWMQIPISIALGWAIYKKNVPAFPASIVALLLVYIFIVLGSYYPITLPDMFGLSSLTIWVVVLLVYAYIASVLPVWRLLQPRDYINGHQLYIILGALVLGAFVLHPPLAAPAINAHPEGAPPIIPFLFITIACGAISGFHSLVGSGTTSKQLSCESDAFPIGYGGMLMEGALAVTVLIAVGAGIGDFEAWNHHYASWAQASGLGAKLAAFVKGSSNMLGAIGLPESFSLTLMGVFVASFAGTTLDTATRLQRYVVGEFARAWKIKPLEKVHPATLVAVLTAAALALAQGGGKGGLILWPLFGASNQLLAALGLLVITIYLYQRKKRTVFTAVPMVFMLLITLWATIANLDDFIRGGKWHLVVINTLIMALSAGLVIESARFLLRKENFTP